MKRFIIFVAVTMLSYPSFALAGSLHGRVTRSGDVPVSGVTIEIIDGDSTVASATSDGTGAYTIDPLPDGAYVMIAMPPDSSGLVLTSFHNMVVSGASTHDILFVPDPDLTLSSVMDFAYKENPVSAALMRDRVQRYMEMKGIEPGGTPPTGIYFQELFPSPMLTRFGVAPKTKVVMVDNQPVDGPDALTAPFEAQGRESWEIEVGLLTPDGSLAIHKLQLTAE